MTEKDLQQIEIRLKNSVLTDGREWICAPDELPLKPDDVRALITEVRRFILSS